jgi:hypothetical protein
MRAPPKHRSARKRRTGLLGRDRWRALVATLAIAGLVALGIRAGDWWLWVPQMTAKKTLPAQPGDEFATGAIIMVPTSGDRCRHLLIDNATWRIRDNGVVDCQTALAQNPTPSPELTTRAEAIRMVFGKR